MNRKGYGSPCYRNNRMDEEESFGAGEREGQPAGPPDQHGPMLWVAIALLGLLIFLVIFANIPDIRASAGASMARQEWQLQSYADETGVMVPAISGSEVTLTFPEAGIAAGRSGCGYYAVNYTAKGYGITITSLVLADLLCPGPGVMDQESAYLEDLTNCTEFRVSETRLEMYGKDGRQRLVFIPRT